MPREEVDYVVRLHNLLQLNEGSLLQVVLLLVDEMLVFTVDRSAWCWRNLQTPYKASFTNLFVWRLLEV